jgi:hypothetical protein
MMSGASDGKWYSDDDFLKLSELSKKELDEYLKRGLLFKQEQGFSTQELKLVGLFKRAKTLGLDEKLFDSYVKSARELAKIEYALGSEMLERDKSLNNKHYELLFDSILTLKPYLFNMHTMQEHQEQMEKKNRGE